MKYITFAASGMLAGLANMLDLLGYDVNDDTIALGMETPYLFLRENGQYFAGAGLYQPKWINLYLGIHGLRMSEIILPKEDVGAFLHSIQTAMLPLTLSKENTHPVVFAGYANGRYEFINIKRVKSSEPDSFSLSIAMLKRRLTDQVRLYTLERCTPKTPDYSHLLLESLKTLDVYLDEVLQVHRRTVTREELKALHEPLLRALMQDMQPMAALIGDITLAEELRQLNHDYRHILTRNSPNSVALYEKLPKSSIKKCVAWLKEDIIDRLYEFGATDELIKTITES